MNSYKANRIICTVCDLALAVLIVLFTFFALMSPTLGNEHFHIKYYSSSQVTQLLQDSLTEKTAVIAERTGIEAEAFDYAVGQRKISATQENIISSIFAGNNYDYTDSASLDQCYRDGITEYYRFNGLDLDKDALEQAIPQACKAFNKVFGVSNSKELTVCVKVASRYSIVLAAVLLVLGVMLALRIFMLHRGRTKMFSHYACALLSSGSAMIAIFVLNYIIPYTDRLYLTNNDAVNFAISQASKTYFLIAAIFGAVFVLVGIAMMKYVHSYYIEKMHKQKQEMEINKDIYIKSENGDLTVEELMRNNREDVNNNATE